MPLQRSETRCLRAIGVYHLRVSIVTQWDRMEARSTAPGIWLKVLPGEHLVALFVRLDPGTSVPYQTHPTEQLVHMLSGQLRIWIGQDAHVLQSGAVVLIPPNVPHRGECVGDEPATYLEVLSPVEERYRLLASSTASSSPSDAG